MGSQCASDTTELRLDFHTVLLLRVLVTTNLCFYRFTSILIISYNGIIQYAILRVWLPKSIMLLRFIHAVAWINISFLLMVEIAHCMDIPCFVYSFISWWTCRLFPLFSIMGKCYEHLCRRFCMDVGFYFSWLYIPRSRIAETRNWSVETLSLLFNELPDSFPKWLHHVPFSVVMYRAPVSPYPYQCLLLAIIWL